jgi:hypothetical protein
MYLNPKFAILIFGGGDIQAKVLNPVTPRLELRGYNDVTGVITYPYKVNEKLTTGLTLRVINRSKFFKKNTNEDVVTLYAADLSSTKGSDIQDKYVDTKSATGIGFDIGARYKLNDKITLGAVIYDVGGTKLKYEDRENEIDQSISIGMSYKLEEFLIAKDLTAGMDITNFSDGGSFVKKLHFGIEGEVARKITLRTGLNQGYPTFGVGLRLGVLQLDYAFFQKELGDNIGDLEEKSHVVGLTLRF